MRLKTHNTLFICLFVLQLFFTSRSWFKNLKLKGIGTSRSSQRPVTSASEATGSASQSAGLVKDDGYWFPLPEKDSMDSLEGYKESIGTAPMKNPSSNQIPSLRGHNFEPAQDTAQLTNYYRSVSLHPSSWESTDPRKAFLEGMGEIAIKDQYHTSLIQIVFKRIWEKPDMTEGEVKQWLEVLTYYLKRDMMRRDSTAKQIPVSFLYGLHSLRLKYHQNGDLLPHIMATSAVVQEYLDKIKSTVSIKDLENVPWQKEMLFPSQGFSWKLGDTKSYKSLISNDQDFQNAMDQNLRTSVQGLTALKTRFPSFSAHKRVLVLATFFQVLKANPNDLMAANLLREIHQSSPFQHEKELITFILQHKPNKSQPRISSTSSSSYQIIP